MGGIFSASDYIPMEIIKENDVYPYHTTNHTFSIAAIIVNVTTGTSYDPLFTKVPQQSTPGTRVITYHCNYDNLQLFSQEMRGIKSNKPVIGRVLKEISDIDGDCTIFNWQCCSGCENKQFPTGRQSNMRILRQIMDKGHMAMFSDFSLKALIQNWDETSLGPNPFLIVGEYSGEFKLGFDVKAIENCPSSQLQIVAKLSKETHCQIKGLQKTILYSIDPSKYDQTKQNIYKLQLLTVAVVNRGDPKYRCRIGEYEGTAGHVLIRYLNGGCILASMGHWCELIKVKPSEAKLYQIGEEQFGTDFKNQVFNNMNRLDRMGQERFMEITAQKMVQQSTPGNHVFRKRKFKIS